MLSVIIATLDAAQGLVPTLAALVPGAMAGLISEVLVADGGSGDDTVAIADMSGCRLLAVDGPRGRRLAAGAAAARASWLLFLQPGTVLDAPWIAEAGRFVAQSSPNASAAVFRWGGGAHTSLGGALPLVWEAIGAAMPRPGQGLLIARRFYEVLGGHRENVAKPEAELLRRIGRRRIVTLAAAAFPAR